MSITEIPFSQLLQHSRETVATLEGSQSRRLRLVRRDGEDLILESAARAEADALALLVAARLISELLRAEDAAALLIRAFPAVFPWMRFLPPQDAHAFVTEFTETARACAEMGSMAALEPVIEAWRSTAEVYADPELLTALTTPHDGTDHGPVPDPGIEAE